MGKLHRSDNLAQVHPSLMDFVSLFVARSERDWMVVTGIRTQAKVEEKWSEGRTTPGPHAGEAGYPPLGLTVTQVRTLEGAPHAVRVTPEGLYGCAVDLQFFDVASSLSPGETKGDQAIYRHYGELAEARGLTWGGRFTKVDQAHIELKHWRGYPLPGQQGTT